MDPQYGTDAQYCGDSDRQYQLLEAEASKNETHRYVFAELHADVLPGRGNCPGQGGLLPALLWVTLVFVAIRIYWKGELRLEFKLHPKSQLFVSLLLGAVLGFVSGTVGIGGGIYLVPLIILFGLGTEQEAAASGAAFILLNSVAGLVARFQRGAVSLELMLPLLLAVLAGGFLGSRLGAVRFNPLTIQKILGLVVILALLLLSRNIWLS